MCPLGLFHLKTLGMQGWKFLTVRLPGTGKNGERHVKMVNTFPMERLNFGIH